MKTISPSAQLPQSIFPTLKSEQGHTETGGVLLNIAVQWLRLHAPNVGGPGSIPGQGTRSNMPQLKISHAATKTRCSQISKIKKKKKKNGTKSKKRQNSKNFSKRQK